MSLPSIVSDPKIMMGKPVIAGTRITVELLLEKLAAGESAEQIMRAHPHLPEGSISAALAYAAALLRSDVKESGITSRDELDAVSAATQDRFARGLIPTPEFAPFKVKSLSGGKWSPIARWFSRFCAALGVLLVSAIVADLVFGFTRPPHDTGGALGAGIILGSLMVAWIPVTCISVVSALLSCFVWPDHSSKERWTALWLSLGGPLAAMLLFGALTLLGALFPHGF